MARGAVVVVEEVVDPAGLAVRAADVRATALAGGPACRTGFRERGQCGKGELTPTRRPARQ